MRRVYIAQTTMTENDEKKDKDSYTGQMFANVRLVWEKKQLLYKTDVSIVDRETSTCLDCDQCE